MLLLFDLSVPLSVPVYGLSLHLLLALVTACQLSLPFLRRGSTFAAKFMFTWLDRSTSSTYSSFLPNPAPQDC